MADGRTIQNQMAFCRPPPLHSLLLTDILFFAGSPLEGYLPANPPLFCYLCVGNIIYHKKPQRPNFPYGKIVVVSMVSRDYGTQKSFRIRVVEQVYTCVDYILEQLLKEVLTNITTVKIRYSGKIPYRPGFKNQLMFPNVTV